MPPLFSEQQSARAQAIFNTIVHQIPKVKHHTELVYEVIDPEKGDLVAHSLRQAAVVESTSARVSYNSYTETLCVTIMPTEFHGAHQRWFNYCRGSWIFESLLNPMENALLDMGVGTTFDEFDRQYLGSSKEPGFFLRPDSNRLPSVVVESGFSESYPRLLADRNMWLNGTTATKVVVLINWTKISRRRVKGSLEVWGRDPAGGLTVHEMTIFPAPALSPPPGTELLRLRKGTVFGQHLVAGENPDTPLSLDMAMLRDISQERLAVMDLIPA